ncbi:type I-F CRISPR-associated endoribonuclease Cas6/Csy4 [Psychromonas algicola]|uniref:type I-F CRISPR-associated endoribonuclease Cas6/Csy4 n=1 Tax=Psychromonas algicola TaxID=2555642 RepID=UPI0010688E35|nr:type I-F CRISPR-associated endoribonuclease Cas6/Csy4 [Psychromonas sp. RZ5]TEW46140.1 type I-F CRISPR-associated endoribonuclease Cas6/Csy4 [Psychromonas sp. RZ5]
MKRYYFMIHFLPKEANLALLTGRCISIMHGFILKRDIQGVGVTLPAWSDLSIGNVIAFVHSDKKVLQMLKEQSYFEDMQNCGFFELTSVTAVPDNCEEVYFKRNQAIAKIFTGESRRRLKRLEKRALSRGETFNPQKCVVSREFDVFHRIAISSNSNQNDYILHIQKQKGGTKVGSTFSNYGFSSNEKFDGSVPDLSHLVMKL